MTTTQQLNQWMRHDPTYLGAFSLDTLPTMLPEVVSFIVNTHTHNLPGQHWMAVRRIQQDVWIFDPLAFPPVPELCNYLLSQCTNLHISRVSAQPAQTQTCGQHCVYYLYNTRAAPSELIVKSFVSSL